MASPFTFFRKNQRAWMAALVVVAIFSFVILPNFSPTDNRQIRRNSQTLVSWKGGAIDADRLQKMQQVHSMTYRIFSRLASEVIQAGGTPNVPGFTMGPQGLELGIERPENIQSVLQVRLFADAARKRGVIVDDKTVDQFIQKFCDRKVSGKRFDEIVREVGGETISKFDMYEFLRDEISKQLLVQMGYSGLAFSQLPIVSPSKNWMNYQKFRQRAKIEAYPVFVDQYLDKVKGKPSEQELRTLYDKGKDLLQQPNNAEPGFRRYHQANIEFLIADLNLFVKEEEAKLSEDFLKETYEKRVAEQGAYKVPVEEFKPTEPAATTETPASEKPATEGPETTPAAEMKPVEKAADEAKSTDDKPAAEAPKVPEPAPPKSSSIELRQKSNGRLVAFQAEADKPAAETPAVAVKETADPGAAEAKTVPAKAEEAAKVDAAKPADPASAQETKSQDAPAEKKDAEKPMRTKSFDEVREDLRRELALEPAQKRMEASIAAAREIMDQYYNQLSFHKTGDPKDPSNVAPALPDLKTLGDKVGLSFGRTGMVNPMTVGDLPIGRSLILLDGYRPVGFPQYVFNNRLRPYQAAESRTMGSQTFLFWKIEEANSRVPAFEEVRDEALRAWNMGEARKLASKAAEELSASINTSTEADPWSKVLDATQLPLVLKPGTFTYLQPMNTGNEGIQLSVIEGIVLPGQVFMDKAFTTPAGKASIALDVTQQKCFVIRVLERTPSDEQLLPEFERVPLTPGVRSLATQQVSLSATRWFDSLIREMDLDLSKLGPVDDSNEE